MPPRESISKFWEEMQARISDTPTSTSSKAASRQAILSITAKPNEASTSVKKRKASHEDLRSEEKRPRPNVQPEVAETAPHESTTSNERIYPERSKPAGDVPQSEPLADVRSAHPSMPTGVSSERKLQGSSEAPANQAIGSSENATLSSEVDVRKTTEAKVRTSTQPKTERPPAQPIEKASISKAKSSTVNLASSSVNASSSKLARGDTVVLSATSASASSSKLVASTSRRRVPQIMPESMLKRTASKGKAKKDTERLTPLQYATKITTELLADETKRLKYADGPLKDKVMYYYGGNRDAACDMTKKRMDLMLSRGATLLPTFDAERCTHIVVASNVTMRMLRGVLGLKKGEVIPDHIPTVKWEFVTPFLKLEKRKDGTPRYLAPETERMNMVKYAAFESRQWVGTEIQEIRKRQEKESALKREKTVGAAAVTDSEKSSISAFTEDRSRSRSRSTSVHSGRSRYGELSSDDNDSKYASDSEEELERARFGRGRREGEALARTDTALTSSSALAPPSEDVSTAGLQTATGDPLAEFYQQAKLERDRDRGNLGCDDSEEEREPNEHEKMSAMIFGMSPWTCDNKGARTTGPCVNQDIVDKLEELVKLQKQKLGDEAHWRAFSGQKAIRAVKNHPKRIKSLEEAKKLPGVGEKTAQKIMEIVETGDLRRIKFEETADVGVTSLFMGIYGVGLNTAFQWYYAGCRTLEDLRQGKGGVRLTNAQKIGLEHYDDINERMPREEAKAIFDLIRPIALQLDMRLDINIMGSFRRGKADCGDIDILITRPTYDRRDHRGILRRLLRALREAKIITEDLAVPNYDELDGLEGCYRGLCRLPNVEGAKRRRIDFLTVPWECRGAALLYYTGDDIFNRSMRLKANKMGWSLNQRGLFANVVRDPRDRRVKMTQGKRIAGATEREIFEKLGVPWQEPHERVRN